MIIVIGLIVVCIGLAIMALSDVDFVGTIIDLLVSLGMAAFFFGMLLMIIGLLSNIWKMIE